MSRILFVGYTPPPFCPKAKVEAAHYRSWQFFQPLMDEGHKICFCGTSIGTDDIPQNSDIFLSNNCDYHYINFYQNGWLRQFQYIHDQFVPDCIIAVTFFPSLFTSRITSASPKWFDIYGDYITAVQANCFRNKSNRGLEISIKFVIDVLKKGDKFSVCSENQQHMLVGELALAKRLNSKTFGYDYVEVIPPGIITPINHTIGIRNDVRRKLGIKDSEKIVLWCGGYNTWTDVDTLFDALNQLMENDSRVHFVSVGASTYQASDNVYERFVRRIESSPSRSKFHLLGWQPWAEVPGYMLASDIGLNIDALHYETIYGTRTRILEMISYNLPIITSLGSELSHFLVDQGCALGFEIGDKEDLVNKILRIINDDSLRMNTISKAEKIGLQQLSFSNTTINMRDWVKRPRRSPDQQTNNAEMIDSTLVYGRSIMRRMLWKFFGLCE
jgi:glycosyltransferase involved in cell wall biosynthesis